MLPVQKIEELISVSYVSAIIARSGFSPNTIAEDYGIDLEVRNIAEFRKKRIDTGAFLALQLKASVNWSIDNEHIVYDIEADAYNRLIFRHKNSSLPCALVLCCLPKNEVEWMGICEEQLTIRRCCYFYFVDGEESDNNRTKRIRIPREQLFTPDALRNLKAELFMGQVS